jgi:class 3 adenylate cyclase
MSSAEGGLIELRRRTAMLDAVAYAATKLVAGANWRNEVTELLGRLGQATDMSRVTLFEVHPDAQGHLVQSCRHDWAEEGLQPLCNDPRNHNMPLADEGPPGSLGDWSLRRQRGEVVQARLSDVTGLTREVFLAHGTLSFLSVPIHVNGEWWGFLGFDDCRSEREWTSAEVGVLRTAAALLAAAIERERADAQLKASEAKRVRLQRYFPPNMIDELIESGRGLDEARKQTITVLFADIWNFSRTSARLKPEKLIALLREYLGFVEEAVFAHGGTLDKFLGDGVMATFGTPHAGPNDAGNALACASAIAESARRWNRQRSDAGLSPLKIGIGLHHGEAVLGDIGSEKRMEFAVIGDTVNIASRIQEATRQLDLAILASGDVIHAAQAERNLKPLMGFRNLGEHMLRGRSGKIALWGKAAERR